MVCNNSKITIIKIGGSLLDKEKFPRFIKGFAPYVHKGKTIIVHGGGKAISTLSTRLGIKTRFVKGRRYTDAETMKVVEMVLSGIVNHSLVSCLNGFGIPAIGLSGRDAKMVNAHRIRSLGLVGVPVKVNTDAICKILSAGFVPVLASVAEDSEGVALNINADEMASALSCALKVHRLILFTDVPGILDPSGKTIRKISMQEVQGLIEKKVVIGGMIPKLNSALRALKKGVNEVWILEGKIPLSQAKGTFLSIQGSRPKHPFF